MTVRVYKDTDGSAPVLTGQAGSLITLLDAILVNGYGAKAAAGWTKPLSTTNKAAYLQNLTGANNASGMLLYVDDTAPTTAKEARVCGFETMSAITPVGTGQFPTAAQSAVGVGTVIIRKSNTADATARKWTAIADGHTLYLFVETGDIIAPNLATCPFVFGDFKSYKAGDQYAVIIIGRISENSANATVDPFSCVGPNTSIVYNLNNVLPAHFVARNFTGNGGSIRVGKVTGFLSYIMYPERYAQGGYTGDAQTTIAAAYGGIGAWRYPSGPIGLPFPNAVDGALVLSKIEINHSWGVRGYLKGLWAPMHDRPLAHTDSWTVAAGDLSGKDLLAQCIAWVNIAGANDAGQVVVETSDTWP